MSNCVVRPERLVPGSLWRLKQPACESLNRIWAIFRRAGAANDLYVCGWNGRYFNKMYYQTVLLPNGEVGSFLLGELSFWRVFDVCVHSKPNISKGNAR
jgi:hypothetical protein